MAHEEVHDENIIGGRDNRVLVSPCTSPPYKWICSLKITNPWNETSWGTGFKIYLPDVNYLVILTAGHCIMAKKADQTQIAMAQKITVKFPDEDRELVGTPENFFVMDRYKRDRREEDDYGLIFLPGTSNDGFGWATDLTNDELHQRIVNNCGFPGEIERRGTMWITGGEITRVSEFKIHYKNDTTRGQSGGPVYTWYKGHWTVIGIHTHGDPKENSGRRLTLDMMSSFMKKMQCKRVLQSVEPKDAHMYLSCNLKSEEIGQQAKEGIGSVKGHKVNPPTETEQFYIYPIRSASCLASQPPACPVVIESVKWSNTFIRLDEAKNTVKLQWGARDWDRFYLVKEEGERVHSIKSVSIQDCRIRVLEKGEVVCYFGSDYEASQLKQVHFLIGPATEKTTRSESSADQTINKNYSGRNGDDHHLVMT